MTIARKCAWLSEIAIIRLMTLLRSQKHIKKEEVESMTLTYPELSDKDARLKLVYCLRELIEFVSACPVVGQYEYSMAKQINALAMDFAVARRWEVRQRGDELAAKYQAGDHRLCKEVSPLCWAIDPWYDLPQDEQDRRAKLEEIGWKISGAVAPFLRPRPYITSETFKRLKEVTGILDRMNINEGICDAKGVNPGKTTPSAMPASGADQETKKWYRARKRMIELLNKDKLPTSVRATAKLLESEGCKYNNVRTAIRKSERLKSHYKLYDDGTMR